MYNVSNLQARLAACSAAESRVAGGCWVRPPYIVAPPDTITCQQVSCSQLKASEIRGSVAMGRLLACLLALGFADGAGVEPILDSEVGTGAGRRPHILFLMVDVACLQDPLALWPAWACCAFVHFCTFPAPITNLSKWMGDFWMMPRHNSSHHFQICGHWLLTACTFPRH